MIISIISILILGFFNIIANKEKVELAEKNKNLENKVLNIENENNNFKSEVDNKNKKIEEMNKSQNQIQEQLQASQGINANEKVILFKNNDNLFYGYIDNGNLYYMVKTVDGQYDNGKYSDFKKYDKLSNIKKVKTYNEGTSVNPAVILLNEDGKIYNFNIFKCFINKDKKIESIDIFNLTKDYDVDNFEFEYSNLSLNLKLTLKDGSQKTIEIDKAPPAN